jgi:hypothetical protein
MSLSDAPFPYESVAAASVTIDSVAIHLDADDDTESGFRTLDRTERTVNLLDLQGGVTETLVSAEIPVGTLDQIRLYVRDASVELVTGETFDLTIPSGMESGIKVFPDPPVQVVGSLTTDLLLDFDVSESFKPIPAAFTDPALIDSFQFHPVLRVSDLSVAGSVAGTVMSDANTPDDPADDTALDGAEIDAYLAGDMVTTTASDTSGIFRLMGLPAGSYSLVASRTGFAPDTLEVEVVAGNETSADFVLTPSP